MIAAEAMISRPALRHAEADSRRRSTPTYLCMLEEWRMIRPRVQPTVTYLVSKRPHSPAPAPREKLVRVRCAKDVHRNDAVLALTCAKVGTKCTG